jgi:hypothetical protein
MEIETHSDMAWEEFVELTMEEMEHDVVLNMQLCAMIRLSQYYMNGVNENNYLIAEA